MQEERCRSTWEAPNRASPCEATAYGLQLLRHGRGTPDTEQCWNLGDAVDHGARQAEQYWQRERPPYALGESYRA
jgi:hypothetical protein